MDNKTPTRSKGQSLVEMALTATLMMFLMLAMIDFGYAFLYWITIRDAAQEGAIYGSLHPGTACQGTLRQWVRGSASSPLINLSSLPDAQIIPACLPNANCDLSKPGDTIRVQVIHKYHILTPMISKFTSTPDITITATVSNTILQDVDNLHCD